MGSTLLNISNVHITFILSVQQFSTVSETAVQSRAFIQKASKHYNPSQGDLFTLVHTSDNTMMGIILMLGKTTLHTPFPCLLQP